MPPVVFQNHLYMPWHPILSIVLGVFSHASTLEAFDQIHLSGNSVSPARRNRETHELWPGYSCRDTMLGRRTYRLSFEQNLADVTAAPRYVQRLYLNQHAATAMYTTLEAVTVFFESYVNTLLLQEGEFSHTVVGVSNVRLRITETILGIFLQTGYCTNDINRGSTVDLS